LGMTIWENLILESHRRPPIRKGIGLDRKTARAMSRQAVEEYEIRTPSEEVLAGQLSGGNQQKVIVAREMTRKPRLLVAVHPTRGLDIRATAYVHRKIQEHRQAGGATLLISSELEEIHALSDRIAVMRNGQVVAVLPASATREEIGLWMTRGATDDPHTKNYRTENYRKDRNV
jgi:general nucleoside transport system ATP-binding protein